MYAIVAQYQIWENYGAHTWDGAGQCPQRWKGKGGEEAVLASGQGVTLQEWAVNQAKYRKLAGVVAQNNEYYREDVITVELVQLGKKAVRSVQQWIDRNIDLDDDFERDEGYARWLYSQEFSEMVWDYAMANGATL
jgi:hypothetical protein